jgi:hypothetical protein
MPELDLQTPSPIARPRAVDDDRFQELLADVERAAHWWDHVDWSWSVDHEWKAIPPMVLSAAPDIIYV